MFRGHHFAAAAVLAVCTFGPDPARAQQQPAGIHAGLELANGGPLRQVRLVTSQPPRQSARAWQRFRAAHPGSWVGSWDTATGVAHRIFGHGIDAPGTSADPKKAAAFAQAFLQQHLDLLAPGAAASDFTLVSNETRGDLRTVAFLQHAAGMRVLGGQLSFRFKNDRLFVLASEAVPLPAIAPPPALIDQATAATQARSWVASDVALTATVSGIDGPFVLPLMAGSSMLDVRTVLRVEVATTSPITRWSVFVDAESGDLVAREQTLKFASGTLFFNAPVRRPGAERNDYPAKYVSVQIDGASATANDAGVLSFTTSPASVSVTVGSTYLSVQNLAGAAATTVLSLPDGGSAVWDLADQPNGDAQLNSFIHAQLVKDYARAIAPEMNWIDSKLLVKVNHNDTCNAFYDGSSINFYVQSQQCENTGRLPDVVYHEFGHGFHHHAVILGSGEFESALSEGVSDYLAATITSDPGMGRGFFYTNAPLRHLDNADHVWPDDIKQDPHGTGLIIGGALWDLRKNLIAKHGEAEGRALTDKLFYEAMSSASDIPSMYPEILAADDDDGNLANGTPNVCEIVEAFSRHGLRTLGVAASKLSVEPPSQDGFEVSLEVEGLFAECPDDAVEDARIEWRLENGPAGSSQTVPMTGGPQAFVGVIPSQGAGQVVRYRVKLDLASTLVAMSFPDNEADPMYQFFVGTVTELYCTDFETDPMAEGWTHGLLAGENTEGADDWQWDTPNGTAQNGDPPGAFSGDYVFGNDLGHGNYNGLYQPNKVNYADSPVIDVGDHEHVRLQYRRWLQVEDGYFDRSRIYANGALAWNNLASSNEGGANVHHTDREWRFHDVDLQPYVKDGEVQIRFELDTDQGLQMGGWTLDDFCIVAYEGEPAVESECGNGILEVGEACDDGNTLDGDGCSASCEPEGAGGGAGDPALAPVDVGGGCGCQLPARGRDRWGALVALGLAGFLARRRRR
jgi:cysteine-rich repeat protein